MPSTIKVHERDNVTYFRIAGIPFKTTTNERTVVETWTEMGWQYVMTVRGPANESAELAHKIIAR